MSEGFCVFCRARRAGKAKQIYMIEGAAGTTYIFDICKARTIAGDGRAAHLVPPQIVDRLLEVNNQWSPVHLDHINPTTPGIIGQRFGGLALFDGTHHAARARRDHLPFCAYLLTAPESHSCLIKQEAPALTAEKIAREIRGVIRANLEAEIIEVEIQLEGNEKFPASGAEANVRRHLSAKENERIILFFYPRKYPRKGAATK